MDEGLTDDEVANWPAAEDGLSDDDVAGWEDVTPTKLGSFARRAANEVAPGAAGGLIGMSLVGPGAALGAPFGPVGSLVGMAGGAIVGGMAGGIAGKYLQDKFLDMIGAREGTGVFSRAMEEADTETNPLTSFAGGLVGGTLPSFGVGRAAMPAARAIGGALQGGIEAGQEAYNGEDLNGAKIGMSFAAGAVAAQPRRWMNPIIKPINARFPLPENMGGKPQPKVVENVEMAPDIQLAARDWKLDEKFNEQVGQHELNEPDSQRGADLDRDFPTVPDSAGTTRPVSPMENEGAAGASLNAEFPRVPDSAGRTTGMGAEHGAALDRDFPMVPAESRDAAAGLSEAWENYRKLPGNSVEDLQPPPPTPQEMNTANDVTTTAKGVAAENYPAPKLNVGNEVGASMEARTAARPNDPKRNYIKQFAKDGYFVGSDTSGLPLGDFRKPNGGPKVKNFKVGELPDDIHAALAEAQPKPEAAQAAIEGRPPVTAPVTPPEPPRPPAAQAAIEGRKPLALKGPVAGNFTPEAMKMRRSTPAREAAPEPPNLAARRPETSGPRTLERVLSPEEQAKVDRAKSIMPEEGVAKFDALPIEERVAAAERAPIEKERVTSNARRETNRPEVETGQTVADKEKAKKIADVNTSVKMAYENLTQRARELVPEGATIESRRDKIIAHAQALWDDAKLLYGGKDPIDHAEGFVATHEFREPTWNVIQKAKHVVKWGKSNSKKAIEDRAEYLARLESGGKDARDYQRAADLDRHTTEFDDAQHSQEQRNARANPPAEPVGKGPGYDNLREYLRGLKTNEWERIWDNWGSDPNVDIRTTRTPDGLIAKMDDAKEGLVSPSKKEASNFTVELSPMDEALDKLIARLPKEVLVVFPETNLHGHHGEFQPDYHNARSGVIRIFDRALQDNPLQTFRHEEVHALKQTNKFKPHEWTILERASKEMDPKQEAWYRKHYEDGGETPTRVNELIKEEQVAILLEHYEHGGEVKPVVARIIEKIKDFFKKLGNALRALDPKAFESVKSIIEKVESGEVGRRKDQSSTFVHDKFLHENAPEAAKRLDKEINDITGGAPISPSMKDWLKDIQDKWHNPPVVHALVDYAKGIAKRFGLQANNMSNFKRDLYQQLKSAKMPNGEYPTDVQFKAIQSALETQGGTRALPADLKAYVDGVFDTMKQHYDLLYENTRDFGIANHMPGYDQLQDPSIKSVVGDAFFPRRMKGSTAYESGPTDVMTGRSLYGWSAATEDRGYFALHNNATGERLVFVPQEGNKDIHILRNGAPQKVLIPGIDDPTKINTVIPLKIKGKVSDWIVTHAHNDEIVSAAGKNTDGTNKVEFHNPLLALADALHGIKGENEKIKILAALKNDPVFTSNDYGKNPSTDDIKNFNLRTTKLRPFDTNSRRTRNTSSRGASRARHPASSTCRTACGSTGAAGSSWPTAKTTGCRCSTKTANY